MILRIQLAAALLLSISIAIPTPNLVAQESHSDSIASHLTNDVFAIIYFDFEKIDVGGVATTIKKMGIVRDQDATQFDTASPKLQDDIKQLRQLGVTRGYMMLRPTDLKYQGTSFVIPRSAEAGDDESSEQIVQLLNRWLPRNPGSGVGLFHNFRQTADHLLLASDPAQLERMLQANTEDRGDRNLEEAWLAVGNGGVGLLLFGNDEIRQVARQLLPSLPAPFENVTGAMIADDLEWIGAEIALNEQPGIRIELLASSPESANQFRSAFEQAIALLGEMAVQQNSIEKSELEFITETMQPEVNGNRLSLSSQEMTEDLDRFARVIGTPLRSARKAAQQTRKMNNIRQLALAMHNYESAYRHFPAQASVNEDREPLLSWRVQILPFIGEKELYDQFHLDEPWDSEHNVKLINRMPQVFVDPVYGSPELNAAGKTVFVVPAGQNLMFDGDKTTRFAEIIDGSSNTILIASVSPENAVPWTKPADWQVDLADPIVDLAGADSETVVLGLADGSVHRLRLDLAKDVWRKLIQHNDGEVIENFN